MPLFRVEMHRRAFRPREGHCNPFLSGMPAPGQRIEMFVRRWEFEAKDEHEVRSLLLDAQKQDLPEVRGFTLRSIERLPDTASAKP